MKTISILGNQRLAYISFNSMRISCNIWKMRKHQDEHRDEHQHQH